MEKENHIYITDTTVWPDCKGISNSAKKQTKNHQQCISFVFIPTCFLSIFNHFSIFTNKLKSNVKTFICYLFLQQRNNS